MQTVCDCHGDQGAPGMLAGKRATPVSSQSRSMPPVQSRHAWHATNIAQCGEDGVNEKLNALDHVDPTIGPKGINADQDEVIATAGRRTWHPPICIRARSEPRSQHKQVLECAKPLKQAASAKAGPEDDEDDDDADAGGQY